MQHSTRLRRCGRRSDRDLSEIFLIAPPHKPHQVERAVETEFNTGPAPPPESRSSGAAAGSAGGSGPTPQAAAATIEDAAAAAAAAAAAGGGGGGDDDDDDDDYDPLEAFMAEVNAEVAANKPGAAGPRPDASTACDDEADPAAEYMEVRLWGFWVGGGVVGVGAQTLTGPEQPAG